MSDQKIDLAKLSCPGQKLAEIIGDLKKQAAIHTPTTYYIPKKFILTTEFSRADRRRLE